MVFSVRVCTGLTITRMVDFEFIISTSFIMRVIIQNWFRKVAIDKRWIEFLVNVNRSADHMKMYNYYIVQVIYFKAVARVKV